MTNPILATDLLLKPTDVAVNELGEIFVLKGADIYKYNEQGEHKKVLNEKVSRSHVNLEKEEVSRWTRKDKFVLGHLLSDPEISDYAKYLGVSPDLKKIAARIFYPDRITVGPYNRFYGIGKDNFYQRGTIAIIDPNDGHTIAIFPAVDKEMLKTRAERLEKVINKEKFEKREELKEYVLKNKEIINDFASRVYLEKILKYVPYDKSHAERKWGNFRKEIVIEWYKGEVVSPKDIAADSGGNFYVTDYWDNKVKVFSRDGKFIKAFGGFGKKSGQFKELWGIGIDKRDGSVYVSDMFWGRKDKPREYPQRRIQKFDQDGKYKLKWGRNKIVGINWFFFRWTMESELGDVVDIAVDSKGDVYLLEKSRHRISKYTGRGRLIKKWGKLGTKPGEFKNPEGICVDGDDNIYVADTDNNRVQKFDPNGKFLMEIK